MERRPNDCDWCDAACDALYPWDMPDFEGGIRRFHVCAYCNQNFELDEEYEMWADQQMEQWNGQAR